MDDTTKTLIIYALIPGLFGIFATVKAIGAYMVRTIYSRIDELEKELPLKLEESQVRQLLNDKLDPLRDDILELKDKLDVIYSFLIKKQ